MSTYIDLDSSYRDRGTYANPANYDVENSQVEAWSRSPRQVTANAPRPGARVLEYAQSVQAKHVILPYVAVTYTTSTGVVVNTHTGDLQRLYLDVHTIRYNDGHLINTLDNRLSKARFVLTQEKIQSDIGGNPVWVLFGSRMTQAMRFSRNEALHVEMMHQTGGTLVIVDGEPITPARQTYCLLEVTPYFRDAEFDNHAAGLTQF